MTITTLASGSSGNCLLVSAGGTHVLVDAGISARRIKIALSDFGISPDDLAGILITHAHSDHISGLATLLKHADFPLYATAETGRQLCYRLPVEGRLHTFEPGESFPLGALAVASIPTHHDTPGSVGYSFSWGGKRAAVVTDLGEVTDEVRAGIDGVGLLVVELNHDVGTLENGGYPYYLKKRILGDHGHLSNEDGAALACFAAQRGAHTLVLAHLSSENNSPSLARRAVSAALDAAHCTPVVAVAPRSQAGQTYEV